MSNIQNTFNIANLANVASTETKTMSSLEIAELTGKNHADVLRDIRNVFTEVGIGESKFAGSYLTIQNKELPCYYLPRRECDLVVSGYSAKYRLAIIDRWQELEAAQVKPLSPMEMVIWSAQQIMRIETEQAEQAKQLQSLTGKVDEVDAKAEAILSQSGYYSVMGYSKLVSVRMTNERARSISLALGKICKAKGINRGETKDPRFGSVFTYPVELLEEYFIENDIG